MKKEIYICDHCGKEIEPKDGFIEQELDDLDFYIRVDLCEECYQELSKYVYDFVRKSEG